MYRHQILETFPCFSPIIHDLFYLCHAFFKNCIHPWFATCVSIHNEICKFISRITWESNIELMYIFLISFQKLSFHLIFYTTGIFKLYFYFYIMESPIFVLKDQKKSYNMYSYWLIIYTLNNIRITVHVHVCKTVSNGVPWLL